MAKTTATLIISTLTAGAGLAAGVIWHASLSEFASKHGIPLPHDAMAMPMERGAAMTTAGPGATTYYCPMHPSYRSDHPGNCPICDMKLIPLEGAEGGSGTTTPGHATVAIDQERRQLIGLKTAKVATQRVTQTIRAAGRVDVDERGLSTVALKYGGWIDKLFVKTTGESIHKGEPLFSIYSPELYQAEVDYQIAHAQTRASKLPDAAAEDPALSSARDRLRLWDVTDEQIAALDSQSPPDVHSTVFAKVDGVVMHRNVVEGAFVAPGTALFEVSDLSKVWILVDVFADEAREVVVGQEASIELVGGAPGAALHGKVGFIYPSLNDATRTVRVRIEVDNPDGQLRPGLYANASIAVDLGDHVVIDDGAILDTGARQLVFVDLGDGKLAPREVKLGARSGGRSIVLEGLMPDEQVVTSGNFLVDSESRLKAALGAGMQGMEGMPMDEHGHAKKH